MDPRKLDWYLTLTRQVLKGQITREQLDRLPKLERVFVGTALLFLFADEYLHEDNVVKGPNGTYGRVIEHLIGTRTQNDFENFDDYYREALHDMEVLEKAVSLGLYHRQSRGGVKRIKLLPPPELIEMLNRYGVTSPIRQFMIEAGQGHLVGHIAEEASEKTDEKHQEEASIMNPRLEANLALTRKVFEGVVTREQLDRMSAHEKVFVGTALMLLFADHYLSEGNVVRGVRGTYGVHITKLVQARAYTDLKEEEKDDSWYYQNMVYSGMVSGVALSLKLYKRSPGRGGIKPIKLLPPPELTRLIKELGVTPAVRTFMIEAGEEEALLEVEQQQLASDKVISLDTYVDTVVVTTRQRYGLYGVQRLIDALKKE